METLQISRAEGIVTITLDRPQRKNAMTNTMFSELREIAREISASADDRVVVLTGAGGDFCSGADLADGDERTAHPLPWMRLVGETCAALHAVPQPMIAKLRGVCVGAGANLALACDLVVADETVRFSEIFVRRGLSIDFGGSYVLPRIVGAQKAKELALFGDTIPAADAERLGIVNRVLPIDELDRFVQAWAERLAAGPPLALATTKRLLNASFERSLTEAIEAEALGQAVNLASSDAVEAIRAFFDKREPQFRGR